MVVNYHNRKIISWVFIINSVKQVQDDLKHQRTEVARFITLLCTVELSMEDLVLLVDMKLFVVVRRWKVGTLVTERCVVVNRRHGLSRK